LSATDSTSRTTTSTSFVTGSNTLSVTITPSAAANKIFIVAGVTNNTSASQNFYTVFRDSTDLGAASNKGLGVAGGAPDVAGIPSTLGISFLDSPNSTSAITYQIRFRTVDATRAANLNDDNTKGSITCLEIKG